MPGFAGRPLPAFIKIVGVRPASPQATRCCARPGQTLRAVPRPSLARTKLRRKTPAESGRNAEGLPSLFRHVGCPAAAHRKAPDLKVQVRGLQTPCFSYSHSFTHVCCGVIPVGSSLVVGLRHLSAESRGVTSRRCLGQILGQNRKLFRNREPAVSFLSQGQKRVGFEARNSPKWMPKRVVLLFSTCLAK